MSRTCRCRHLPPTRDWGGSLISKVSDGSHARSWLLNRDLARAQVEAEFGPRPIDRRMVHVRGFTRVVYHHATYKTVTLFDKPFRLLAKPDWRETLPGRMMKTWEAWAWDREVDRRLAELVVPITAWHPLQRRGPAGSRKKYERVKANRRMRHATRQTLATSTLNDDWDAHVPLRNTYFDWQNIY